MTKPERRWEIPVLAAATAIYAGIWAYGLLAPDPPQGDINPTTAWLVFGGSWAYAITLLICAGHMAVALWRKKRSGAALRQP